MGPAIAACFVVLYAAFIFFMIRWASRRSKNLLSNKQDVMNEDLVKAGGKQGTATGPATLYVGSDVPFELDGQKLVTNVRYVSRSWMKVSLKAATNPLPWVTVFPEGGVDKFGKVLGLNREVQTGDTLFDDRAYVDSAESDEAVKRLLQPDVRAGVYALLELGFKVQFSPTGVEAFQVVQAWSSLKEFKSGAAGRALLALAKTLEHVTGFEVSAKPPGAAKAAWVALGIVGVSAAGFFGAAYFGSQLGNALDGLKALGFVLGAGGLLWAGMLLVLIAVIRGQSNAMRWLLFAGVFSVFGLPALGGTLVLYLNQVLDSAPATTQQTHVLKKYSSKNGHSFTVEGWPGVPGRPSIDSCWKHYQEYQVGDVVTLTLHPGAFGLAWAEKL